MAPYNPVSNPNPEVSKAKRPTGVQSQGYSGGIRPYMGDPNVIYADGPTYGEDQCIASEWEGQVDEDGDFD